MHATALFSALLVFVPALVQGQSVPLLSAEITAGAGAHTGQTANAAYRSNGSDLVRMAATVRLGTAGAIRPTLTIEHTPDGGFGWQGAERGCESAPRGGCYRDYTLPQGNAIAIGATAARGNVLGGVSAGVAQYSTRGRFIDVNMSLRLMSHVGIVGHARFLRWSNEFRESTWYSPLSVGVRVF